MRNPSELSSAPKTFGVLSIVFSSIVLLWSLPSTLMLMVPFIASKAGNLTGKNGFGDAAMVSSLKLVYGGIGFIGLLLAIMSGLLLAIGIGQVRYRRWAQKISVYWGWAGLAAIVVMVLLSVFMIGPGYSQMIEAASAARSTPAVPFTGMFGKMFGGVYAMVFVLLYSPYPILLLVAFSRDRVKSAMIR